MSILSLSVQKRLPLNSNHLNDLAEADHVIKTDKEWD
jgi:hypothetical protein